ncbi:MAG: acetamidase/formamidase family protein [Deltaproteobacteria bacterium]|nr:acetamidase/formamidase family protein [Deltaproteobacteria bacterium]
MEKNGNNRDGMDRREFFQYAGIAGAALALGTIMPGRTQAAEAQRKEDFGKAHVIEFNKDTGTPGFWDNSRAPVLTIKSGEVVHIETGMHLLGKMKPGVTIEGWKEYYEQAIAKDPDVYTYPDEKTGAKKIQKGAGHHTLVGPINIEEAEPGDTLQVEILAIDPGDYGFNLNPITSFMNLGLLAEDYPEGKIRWYEVNREKMTMQFQPGIEVPVRPFPGTIGVDMAAPGKWSNVPPGLHGGNMDNKEMVAGTVIYLPVQLKGGMLRTGDSHLAQGDGEVNLNAIEGSFKAITLRITVRKDLKKLVDWPMRSTPTHWITMGMHTNLLESSKMATRKAIYFLRDYYGLDEVEAYALCSEVVDLRVTQLVDYTLGIHAMIPKSCFVGEKYASKNKLLIEPQA